MTMLESNASKAMDRTVAVNSKYDANISNSDTKRAKCIRKNSIKQSMAKNHSGRIPSIISTVFATPPPETHITEEMQKRDLRSNSLTPIKLKCNEPYELSSRASNSSTSEDVQDTKQIDDNKDIVQNSQTTKVSKLRKTLERRKKSESKSVILTKLSPNVKLNFNTIKNDFEHKKNKSNFDTSTPVIQKERISNDNYKQICEEVMEKNCKDEQIIETDDESNRMSLSLDLNESDAIKLLHNLNDIVHLTDIEMSSIPITWNCNDQSLTDNVLNVQDQLLTKQSEFTQCVNTSQTKTNSVSENQKLGEPIVEGLTIASKKSPQTSNKSNTFGKFNNTFLKENQNDKSIVACNVFEELVNFEKKENLSEELKDKLRKLKVQLRHNVPPQHKIENNAGSHVPTQEQKRLFEKYGPLKKGFYSAMEDRIIVNNWEAFCKVHKWNSKDVKAFLYLRHKNKLYMPSLIERKKFVQFLADGLPWRTLYSVYHRFRVLYGDYLRQRYSKKENKTILAYIQNSSHNNEQTNRRYSDLAKVLKRSRSSIWKRYQILKQDIQEKGVQKKVLDCKIRWTSFLIAKFIQNLLKVTLSEDIEELKDATIPTVVWQKLENKLEIDQKIVKQFWLNQLHMQLFCKDPIYMNDIKIKLIEYVYQSGISNIKEIAWSKVVKHFDGMTSTFLSNIFFRIINGVSFKNTSSDLWRVVKYLYETRISQLKNSKYDKFLPRIAYKHERIQVIDAPFKRIKQNTLNLRENQRRMTSTMADSKQINNE